jgi:cytochrome c-type biogenesis protein CcmH
VTSFIVICALLVALAVALLAWPLLRPAGADQENAPRANIAATVVAAALPLVAFAAYFWASDWPWDSARQAAPAPAANLQQLVAQLQERLARQPDDVTGWKLLGRTAVVTGDFQLAREAFGQTALLASLPAASAGVF